MEFIISIFEQFFDKLGMMRGDFAQIKRFSFGLVLSFGILYLLKPSIMFNEKGYMRPWALLVQGTEDEKQSTIAPIWLVALLLGTLPALFI